MFGVRFMKFFFVVVVLVMMPTSFTELLLADGQDQGPLFFVGFSGSYFDPGWQFKLDATGGYQFNRHFEITAGLPVYFIRPPDDTTEEGTTQQTGIGDLYFDLRGTASYSSLFFSSSVRVAAPTGDKDEGFSTGKVTYDWNNYIEYSLGNWTPFGSAGIANTISDTHFLTRPFSSFGFVGQFEGGLLFDPTVWIGFGASGYAVVPNGDQQIFYRHSGQGGPRSEGMGNGRRWFYEEAVYEVTDAEDLRDHGFSAWLDVYPIPNVALEFGYSRSVSYEYNTLFFSTHFDLAGMIRKDR